MITYEKKLIFWEEYILFCNTILDAIGNTPLIKLSRMVPKGSADIYVKYEGANMGGSIKTRTAYHMINEAIIAGRLKKDSIIVEPTSGNQGIGLAMVGAVLGYPVKIIMPDSVSMERRYLISQYGAEVILVPDEGDIGKCIEACLEKALLMQAEDSRVFIPQQFTNPDNPAVHMRHTGPEILAQLNAPIHGFCAGVGTGGTISGVGTVLKEANPEILIWAVEPEHAAILSGGHITTHLQMGIGDGLIPENLNTEIYDDVCIVRDGDAIETAKKLAREEGILAGISSGSNVAAALQLAKKLGAGKNVVTILPDTGERYFSTPLFES